MHRDDFTVREPQGHLGAAGQRFRPAPGGGPGAQPPVQFIDPVTEEGQFVGTLYRLGRVAVIADHTPVVLDLDLQPIASLPQPGQLSREVIACRIR